MTTDDEAFVRAIVDRPGDDLPRLVYADWLDERNDPRGAYLRAEREWAKAPAPAAGKKLRAGSKKLDPVWIARVSRPPLGVCCEHLALSTTGKVNEPEEIDAAGDDLGVTIPPQLRALLLNYSLGHLKGGPFVMPRSGSQNGLPVDGFVCLTDPDLTEGMVSCELVDRTEWEREEYSLDGTHLFLAATFDDVDFVVSHRGPVYEMDGYEMLEHAGEGIGQVATSIGAFLAKLVPKTWPLTDDDLTQE